MKRGKLFLNALLPVVLLSAVGSDAWAGGGRNRLIGSDIRIEPVRAPIKIDGDLSEWDSSKATLLTLGDSGSTDSDTAYQHYTARMAFRFDSDALYVAVWWTDPTPLGAELSEGCFPASDGLVLHLPLQGMKRMALWRDPASRTARAVLASGDTPLAQGQPLPDMTQGFQVAGKESYSQEIRIPWKSMGGMPKTTEALRMAVDLCYGGFDSRLGYQNYVKSMVKTGYRMDRWGGNMGLGFVDGFATKDSASRSADPRQGALVRLAPSGTAAPENKPVNLTGDEQTHTTEMVAVPAGAVVVDGVLDEKTWNDAPGTTLSYEPTLFPGRYSTTLRWAYTDQGLYAGLRWNTAGPQYNINNPDLLACGYDGGDALQLRFATDRMSHVDLWQFTEKNRPAMSIAYGLKLNEGLVADALTKGARLAFKPVSGGGYTEELFLPWSLITENGKALKQGDSFRVMADLFFSGLEGNRIPYLLEAKLVEPTGVVGLPFTAPEDGYYTVVIDNAQGETVRRLLACSKLSKGQRIDDWDGLNDDGKPVPAGDYRFRGLFHHGIGLKYLATYNNPGNPPWSNAEGTGEWGGDHSSPQTVAAGDSGIFLGWPAAEDGHGIIGCDFTGRRQWGFFQTPHPSGWGGAYLAADGQYLYFLNDTFFHPKPGEKDIAYVEALLTCLDTKTGQKARFSTNTPYLSLARYGSSQVKQSWWWDLWQKKEFSLDTYSLHDDYYGTRRCLGGNAGGLAAANGKIYISFRLTGEVVVFNAADMKEAARWPLPKPAGLAVAKNGDLFAISDRSVVRLDPATGKAIVVVSSGLEAPVGLALDASGNLFVSDWGGAQCVKVFSPKGVFLRTIGKQGGRAWLGNYDPKGMLLPRGIAIDREGKLWVAEDDSQPRRVSVWNASNGALIKEIIGGTGYGAAAGGMIDPSNPHHAISQGVMFDIDLEKGTYRPLASLWRRTSCDAVFEFAPCMGQATTANRFVERDGRRFMVSASYGATVIGEFRKDGTWTPLAAAGGIVNRPNNPMVMSDALRAWRWTVYPEFLRKHAGENYVWTDLNADGLVQEEEMQWQKISPEFPCLGVHNGPGGVDDGFNFYQGSSDGKSSVVRFEFQGWTPNGAPKFDFAHAKLTVKDADEFRSISVGSKGEIFGVLAAEVKRSNIKPSLSAYDPQGKLLWRYNTSSDYRPMGSINGGSVMGPLDAGGEAGTIVSLTQWHGLYVPFLTSDGLFIGRVLRDPSEGGSPGADMYRGETVQYLNRLNDGRIIRLFFIFAGIPDVI